MSSIKMVQYGVGNMSKYSISYAMKKGIDVVAGFDICESKIGNEFESLSGKHKVQDAREFENFIKSNKVDIVVVTTRSLIKELEDVLTICAENGVNAITICEEAFYPKNSSPRIYNKINELAKKNKCKITGTGYQDVFWGNLIMAISGATIEINKIVGSSSYDVRDYGEALAKAHGVGLTKEEFDNQIAVVDRISDKEREVLIENGEFLPSYMWNTNGWLAERLNLEVISQKQECVPIFADDDMKCEELNIDISKGLVRGMSAVVTTETKQGITIISECVGKVYTTDEYDKNIWKVEGEPSTEIVVSRPCTVELTCATLINRIFDLLQYDGFGYIETCKMPSNLFKQK
ncbi:MAG: dihydrodipicolinate reductase [Clostridia bacterium]|nr:dihydrodipicolinate reductase [Clostridia bacterium]